MRRDDPRNVTWPLGVAAMVFGSLMSLDHRLGALTWLFNEGLGPGAETTGLFVSLLGLVLLTAGEIAWLKKRVEGLERRTPPTADDQNRQ